MLLAVLAMLFAVLAKLAILAALAVLVVALLAVFVPESHVKPNAPKPKSIESAISFFIFSGFSCLLQRFSLLRLVLNSRVPNRFYYGTLDNIMSNKIIVNSTK